MQAAVRVSDNNGNPIPGTRVAVTNNSGFNDALTDHDGWATVKLGELDVQELRVGGKTVLSRPNAYWFGSPNVRNGLIIEVKMEVPVQ